MKVQTHQTYPTIQYIPIKNKSHCDNMESEAKEIETKSNQDEMMEPEKLSETTTTIKKAKSKQNVNEESSSTKCEMNFEDEEEDDDEEEDLKEISKSIEEKAPDDHASSDRFLTR